MEMEIKSFALVSSQGTACAETCLCAWHWVPEHKNRIAREIGAANYVSGDAPIPDSWTDCSNNDAMECTAC